MSNIYALCKFCEVENEFIPLEVRPYSDDFQAGAASRDAEVEQLRQQLADSQKQAVMLRDALLAVKSKKIDGHLFPANVDMNAWHVKVINALSATEPERKQNDN